MNKKPIFVAFANTKLEKDFEKLKKGKFEDKQLYDFIQRAISDLKKNPICGVKITRKLWPRGYIKKYNIKNLWKYNLPDGWRLIYSILEDKLMIINLILEWFPHKDYEKKFGY
jgi:hypothetical protein